MGQKVNPISMRLGINRTWDSRWYAGKNEYSKLIQEDIQMRAMILKDLKNAAIANVVIERPHKKCLVTIHSGRPGLIIGKKGADIENLKKKLQEITSSDVVRILCIPFTSCARRSRSLGVFPDEGCLET